MRLIFNCSMQTTMKTLFRGYSIKKSCTLVKEDFMKVTFSIQKPPFPIWEKIPVALKFATFGLFDDHFA